MSIDWPRWDEEITRLYVTEDKSAEDTIKSLHQEHNVKITIKQFKKRYSGLKKLRSNEWKIIKREVQRRKAEGKDSTIFFNNRQLGPERVAREMRRYSGARGRGVTGDELPIDFGIDTVGKYRIEIRTPGLLTIAPPLRFGPQTGEENSRTAVVNESSQQLVDFEWPDFDLDNADLSTPRLEFDDTYHLAGNMCQKDLIHKTPLRKSSLLIGGENESAVNYKYRLPRSQSSHSVSSFSAGGLNIYSPSLFPRIGRTSWLSEFTLPKFFMLPDVISFLKELESSSALIAANVARFRCETTPRKSLRQDSNGISSQICNNQPQFKVFESVIVIADWLLRRSDTITLDDIHNWAFLIKIDERLFHLLFSVFFHLCCNKKINGYEIRSFVGWMSRMSLKDRLLAYMRKNPKCSNALAEATARGLLRYPTLAHSDEHITWLKTIVDLYSHDDVYISKGVAGLLLHSTAILQLLKAAEILIRRGADLNAEAILIGKLKSGKEHMGSPLCQAVCNEKVKMVELLIEAGSDVNKEFGQKPLGETCSALNIAISDGFRVSNAEIAEILLAHGASAPSWDHAYSTNILKKVYDDRNKGQFPLLRQEIGRDRLLVHHVIDAAEAGNEALSQVLIQYNIIQETALEYVLSQAVVLENVIAARTLLRRGVDPDVPCYHIGCHIFGGIDDHDKKVRPIHSALFSECSEIAYLLLRAGALIDQDTCFQYCQELLWSTWSDRSNWVPFTLSMMMSGYSLAIGPSALCSAAAVNDLISCGNLLDLGAPIDAYGAPGKNVNLNSLQIASEHGNLILVQLLLDRGADKDFPAHDFCGRTALQRAVEVGDATIIEYLLDAGADVKAPPAKIGGVTILEAEAERNYGWKRYEIYLSSEERSREEAFVVTFRRLLALGAPINRQNGSSGTVLHRLARRPSHECLEVALKAGARVEDREESKSGLKTPLQVAAEEGELEAVRLLLDYGADVNAPPGDEFGRTALQAATSRKIPEPRVVELLLSAGAEVNAPPAREGGITALQAAAISGNFDIAQMLLARGAHLNAAAATEEGRTAIEGAAEHGRLDMVRFLLGAGATGDPEKGLSRAIELAEKEGNFTVAKHLRDHESGSAFHGSGLEDMASDGFDFSLPSPGFVFTDDDLQGLVR